MSCTPGTKIGALVSELHAQVKDQQQHCGWFVSQTYSRLQGDVVVLAARLEVLQHNYYERHDKRARHLNEMDARHDAEIAKLRQDMDVEAHQARGADKGAGERTYNKTLSSRLCWRARKAPPSLVKPGDSRFLCLDHIVKSRPCLRQRMRRCVEMRALVFEMKEGLDALDCSACTDVQKLRDTSATNLDRHCAAGDAE